MASVNFEGKDFELKTGKLNGFVMAQFYASTADTDPDSQLDPDLMIALMQESIADKDWHKFVKLARKTDDVWEKAFDVVFKARVDAAISEVTGERPTGQPVDSSDGQESTEASSVLSSDAKILELANGRIDKYAMLKEAQKVTKARAS